METTDFMLRSRCEKWQFGPALEYLHLSSRILKLLPLHLMHRDQDADYASIYHQSSDASLVPRCIILDASSNQSLKHRPIVYLLSIVSDMRFVQNFTPPDFLATPYISPNLNRWVYLLEVVIGCTVNCRASAIIYRVLEFMPIFNW